ncbi:MAG: hypothetical protein PHV33_08750 [Elusimicrobiales bacterium]|nr:hypothetical protein [Elusimicrobiales bacterium]
MEQNLPQKKEPMMLAAETAVFAQYLQKFKLPVDNVIATTEERRVLSVNLPGFLDSLPEEEKTNARYLSKFVGATAIGLFDAALNYIWNEVVLNLRKKASVYGVDLFYDAAVGGALRASFNDEADMDGLKDSVLLDTCRKLELISDVVYKKLDHILTMRNEVAASHPNVESIGGYELLGWLQTCVKDVLQDRPSESAIRIKSLVSNLKTRPDLIDETTALRFHGELRNLAVAHVHNLLITIFAIFSAEGTSQVLRANILKIAPSVWDCSEESVRFRIGATIDGYRTNLQKYKLDQGVEFLKAVGGRMYETLPTRTLALSNIADRLSDAHDGMNNFYTEPPIMMEVFQFCQKSSDIPNEVRYKLVKAVMRCRIGRAINYRDGVSSAGRPLYDKFLGILDDNGIVCVVLSLFEPEINAKLEFPTCQNNLKLIFEIIKPLAVSGRVKDMMSYLASDIPNAHKANHRKDFQQLTSPLIRWS